MRNPPRKCIATKALLLLVLWLTAATAFAAEVVATVVNLSGPLLAKRADGSVKVLVVKSAVNQGDTLVSEKDTYARIRFTDNSEMTLRPNSQLKIDDFSFDESKPENDRAAFSLVKGGLRAVTGALGKRNSERFGMNTPTATIGIRGTTFIAHYVPPPPAGTGTDVPAREDPLGGLTKSGLTPGSAPLSPPAGSLAAQGKAPSSATPGLPPSLSPGLHLQVTDGAIIVTNNGGSLGFQAGQFGYVPNINQPPVIVPSNPNIQFVPPPSFDAGAGGPTSGQGPGSGNATDCIVR